MESAIGEVISQRAQLGCGFPAPGALPRHSSGRSGAGRAPSCSQSPGRCSTSPCIWCCSHDGSRPGPYRRELCAPWSPRRKLPLPGRAVPTGRPGRCCRASGTKCCPAGPCAGWRGSAAPTGCPRGPTPVPDRHGKQNSGGRTSGVPAWGRFPQRWCPLPWDSGS